MWYTLYSRDRVSVLGKESMNYYISINHVHFKVHVENKLNWLNLGNL